jgi:hypothetical protein
MALPNPDEKGNTGAGTEPLNFGPTAPGPGYDSEGYPLPSADQIKGASYSYSFDTGAKTGQVAYDPAMQPPQPESDNPFQPGTNNWNAWRTHNQKLQQNQDNKKAWQKQHESAQRKPIAAAPAAAPVQPFQSSGIDLTKTGKGESVADSINAYYNEHGIPLVGNESKVTLDKFRESQPQDLSPYYDYASKLTSAKIDNAMSARGSYGSSNATGQIGAAEMALRAEEANANAKYGLDRYAREGELAGGADASAAVANEHEFSWAKGLSDIAFKSQDAGEGRGRDLFDYNYKLAAAKAGNWVDSTGKAITGVGEATDAANDVLVGNANDKVSGANTDANVANEALGETKDAFNAGATNYTGFKTEEDAKAAANKPKAN